MSWTIFLIYTYKWKIIEKLIFFFLVKMKRSYLFFFISSTKWLQNPYHRDEELFHIETPRHKIFTELTRDSFRPGVPRQICVLFNRSLPSHHRALASQENLKHNSLVFLVFPCRPFHFKFFSHNMINLSAYKRILLIKLSYGAITGGFFFYHPLESLCLIDFTL